MCFIFLITIGGGGSIEDEHPFSLLASISNGRIIDGDEISLCSTDVSFDEIMVRLIYFTR